MLSQRLIAHLAGWFNYCVTCSSHHNRMKCVNKRGAPFVGRSEIYKKPELHKHVHKYCKVWQRFKINTYCLMLQLSLVDATYRMRTRLWCHLWAQSFNKYFEIFLCWFCFDEVNLNLNYGLICNYKNWIKLFYLYFYFQLPTYTDAFHTLPVIDHLFQFRFQFRLHVKSSSSFVFSIR